MEENWLELLQKNQLETVIKANDVSSRYGLALTREDAEIILAAKKNSLAEQRRVEFGETIMPKIIYEFCDSQFISQDNYVETLVRLQDIFYLYKNEVEDMVNDGELLHVMKEMFEEMCKGDLDYLEETCLYAFADTVRFGYTGYKEDEGYGEARRFDSGAEWHYQLFLKMLGRA